MEGEVVVSSAPKRASLGSGMPAESCCEFVLRNACVAYTKTGRLTPGGYIKVHVIQTNHSHPSGWAPVGFLGHFEEGKKEPQPGTHRDSVEATDRELLAKMQRTWYPGRTGFVAQLTMDNIWHVLFNAIPMRELFIRRGVSAASVDFLPRYTQYWPVWTATQFLRLPAGQQVHGLLKPVTAWPGWEILLQGVLEDRREAQSLEKTRSRTQRIFSQRSRWHCYSTLVGGREGWWPDARRVDDLISARPRVHAFRQAVFAHLALPSGSAHVQNRVIFELRSQTRVIANQDELAHRVANDAKLAGAIDFVSLEALPVAEQIRRVATSTGLAGAHGAGLSFIAFLPSSDRVRCYV